MTETINLGPARLADFRVHKSRGFTDTIVLVLPEDVDPPTVTVTLHELSNGIASTNQVYVDFRPVVTQVAGTITVTLSPAKAAQLTRLGYELRYSFNAKLQLIRRFTFTADGTSQPTDSATSVTIDEGGSVTEITLTDAYYTGRAETAAIQSEAARDETADLKTDTQTIYNNAVTVRDQIEDLQTAIGITANDIVNNAEQVATDKQYVQANLPAIVAANENVTELAGQVAADKEIVHEEMLQAQANRFLWRGDWQATTVYAIGDGVQSGGNSYRCKTAHTSGATFSATNWGVMAQGGSAADGSIAKPKLSTDLQNELAGDAAVAYKASLAIHAGLSTLIDSVTTGTIVNTDGSTSTGQNGNNRLLNEIPVPPSGQIIMPSGTGFSGFNTGTGYVAEYDINHKFLRKQATFVFNTAFSISSDAYFVRVGFFTTNNTSTAVLKYVTTPTVNAKITSATNADNATVAAQVNTGSIALKNVSLFSSSLSSSNVSLCTAISDGDGFVVTAIAATGHYTIFNTLSSLLANEKYQLTIYYELIDLNCTSVDLRSTAYFASNAQSTRTLFGYDTGIATTLTQKSVTATGSNFTSGAQLICTGNKIDGAKDYFAKVRVRNVTIVTYTDDLQQLQSIDRQFGTIAEGATKYLSYSDLSLYNSLKAVATWKNYSLVRADNAELTKRLIGKTLVINSTTTNQDQDLGILIPPALIGVNGYLYFRFEVTLNTLNADYHNLTIRAGGTDYTVEFTRADIGIKRTISYVVAHTALSSGSKFLLFSTSQMFTGGTQGAVISAGGTYVSVTINSFSCYASEKKMPQAYHADFFDEKRTEDILPTYVTAPYQTLTVNLYGHSIAEHNYLKYLGIKGYDFNINIYGLRSTVSNISNVTPGCDTYTVMTDSADIIVTLFGQHDYGRDCPLGAIGTLDKATYIGAYEVLLRGLQAKYPGKLIIANTDTPRNLTSTDSQFFYQKNNLGLTMRDYADALIKLCNFYSIPVVDLHSEIGVNDMNMGGFPNLYVPGTATDNLRINADGSTTTDNTYFSSAFIAVAQGKLYGSPLACYFAEYDNTDTFIRRSPLSAKLYMHPSTAKVRLCVQKTAQIISGTSVGVDKTRFYFADLANALMEDRIHPNERLKRRMSAANARLLRQVIDYRRQDVEYNALLFTNAD